MSIFKWYRKLLKGSWYKYRFTGQLPGTGGDWWSRIKHHPHRYYILLKEEHY